MTRHDLDHLLRAAGRITGHRRFVLVGSAAIFAWREAVPEIMALSREADLYASDVTEAVAEQIADALEEIGQLSTFDDTFGYHIDGVGPQTAVLPVDWRSRSMEYSSPSTEGVVAIVPHPEDIALSKLCAGREKDLDWVAAAYASALIALQPMEARLEKLPDRPEVDRERIRGLIESVKRGRSRP